MLNQLKEIKVRAKDAKADEIQDIIDAAIKQAEINRTEQLLAEYKKPVDTGKLREERLLICKEVLPILIATSSPQRRNPHQMAEQAIDYADALILQLDN